MYTSLISKQMLARPEVHFKHQYNFAGSITMVFASGVGLCPGQPQLRGKRRFERPRRGMDDLGSCALSRKAERWPVCRMGRWPPTWKSEMRNLGEVRGRRFRVALLPTEIPGSREPGLRLDPQLGPKRRNFRVADDPAGF